MEETRWEGQNFSEVVVPQEEEEVTISGSTNVHKSVHRDTIMKVTNKMQLYRLIYYS